MGLNEVLETLRQLFGVCIEVYDTNFYGIRGVGYNIPYCSCVRRGQNALESCRHSDTAALERVRDSGEFYFYECPFGLFEAVFPIKNKEELLGFLMFSPMLDEGEEAGRCAVEKTMARTGGLKHDTLLEMTREISRFDAERRALLERVAPIFADYIARNNLLPENRPSIGYLVKQYVRQNLGDKISLQSIASALHCSTVTLTESFRREYGMTIMQYVLQKRMERSEELLCHVTPPLTIGEVAERCGFSDMEYFSKCFKDMHGVSPSVWRKEKKQA